MQDRISATITSDLVQFARSFAQEQKTSVSEVLEIGLQLLQQKHIQAQMKQGYTEDTESLDWSEESLKITTLHHED